ncbi:hypothetical protein DV454_002742 [Geotrichum candidum]|nr:hypothetical protein DV454_002742 [Geotrichum candidum]
MPSVFIGVYKALYPYTAQTNEELTIGPNDLLYLLEKSSTDDWWKVKKKIPGSNVEEPSGLVPNNYIQPNAEELSFNEGQIFDTYDPSDTEWVLVGFNDQYGFVPGNYIDRSPQNSSATRVAREPVPSASVPSAPVPSSAPKQAVQKPLPDMPRDDPNDDYERSPQRFSKKSGSISKSRPSESPAPAASPAPRHEVNTWQVQEIDGKKKYKATLTVFNNGIKFTPSNTSSSYANEWSILDLYYYNSEKKHIFLEFNNPKVSLELHAGSKDNAEEIVSVIGAIAGANKANGLREVITASRSVGHKMGKVLYDFEAQGDDEVSVKEGETIYVINDEESPEWWMVKTASGKQGVIPSTYVEVEKDYKSSKKTSSSKFPTRGSSSSKIDSSDKYRGHIRDTSKSVPDANKVRTWSDRTNSFKVEAQLLGCVDGKIHLHKTNGVKIAVAASKMSLEDIEYVERVTGKSLESEKDPKSSSRSHRKGASSSSRAPTYASPSQQAPPPQQAPVRNPNDYDWLNFFQECGIDPSNCNKYAINFNRDQMDESVLEQINPQVLRTLGLKEGDILRVMKKLDDKYHRSGAKQLPQQQPPVQQVQQTAQPPIQQLQPIQPQPAPVQPSQPQQPAVTGFTDNAWTVKTPSQPQTTSFASAPTSSTQSLPSNQPTGALQDLLDFGPRPTQSVKSASTTMLPQTQANHIASTPTGGANFLQPNRTGGATAVVTVPVSIPIQFQPVASISVQPANPFNASQQPLQSTLTGGNIFNTPIQPMITGGNAFNPQVQHTVTGGNAFGAPIQPTMTGGNVFAQPTITGGNPFAPQPTVSAGNNIFAQPTTTGGNAFAQPTLTGGNIFNTPAQSSLTGGNVFANPVQSSLTGGNIFNAPMQSQPTGGNVFNAPLQNQMTGSGIFNAPVQPQRTGGFMGNSQPSFGTNSFNAGFTSHPSGSVPNLSTPNPFAMQQQANSFGMSQPQATTGSGMFGNSQPMNTLANQFSQVSLQSQQQQQFGFQQQQQQQQMQPLQTQATGFGFGNTTSAPAISFGAAPLQPTLTGRRANIASATPQNPFGF